MSDHEYIYANVAKGDHARLEQLAKEAGMSQSAFVRMCINDWLEEAGEPELAEVPAIGRPRKDQGVADARPKGERT